jgi:hypothetical protein
MEQQQITLIAKAENGKISIHTEIPAPGDDETYIVTIGVTPQSTSDTAASAGRPLWRAGRYAVARDQ